MIASDIQDILAVHLLFLIVRIRNKRLKLSLWKLMKTHRAKVPDKWRQRLVHLPVGRVKRRRLGLGDGVFRQPFLELGVLDELLRTLEVLFNR